MKRSRAIVENRREKVLAALKENGLVKVGVLAAQFQVSPLTIRRDLQYLEEHKKLERFYGGATMTGRETEPECEESELRRYDKNIANYAASFVEDGDIVFINNSATALQMLSYLEDKHVTVITNNGRAIHIPCGTNVKVILTGGEVRDDGNALVGEFALSNLGKVTAKKCFLGCSGLSLDGMTTDNLSEANINEMMVSRTAGETYILADNSKIGRNCSFVCCPPVKLSNIITDEKAGAELLKEFRSYGIRVHTVTRNQYEIEEEEEDAC